MKNKLNQIFYYLIFLLLGILIVKKYLIKEGK